ncbi:MAG: 2-oxoacid:acceptor oxidoreductase family protein [Candidatus Bathyarchaeia archaeon]
MPVLKEIRWHGRGGQGVVTASQILAQAALSEGRYVQAFPEFGPERTGAPLRGFTRISDRPIDVHSQVYTPRTVVVIDPTLLKTVNVTSGLQKGGRLLVNTTERPKELKKALGAEDFRVYTVDATRIALDLIGGPFFNTPMLGALIRVTRIVPLDSVVGTVEERFRGEIAERNVAALKRAFEEVRGA